MQNLLRVLLPPRTYRIDGEILQMSVSARWKKWNEKKLKTNARHVSMNSNGRPN